MLSNGSIFNTTAWNTGSSTEPAISAKMVNSKNSRLRPCFGAVTNGDMILWKMPFAALPSS
ncbi:Uncharacterised protein [Vibrio cholerae]|uniref:Uncharacterized protein n=1 Tax=Vibrio cholerae TaxID=666 RepID=A0A655QJX3_VIBCL|nr:Uncharacterised protein [Vibrio cholerae]